jgi:hypothetical protein
MNFELIKLWAFLLIAVIPGTNGFAQKVNVGYDKSANFSRYASYTWAEPEVSPSRPLLYASIVGSIDHELKAKGLTRTDSGGDYAQLWRCSASDRRHHVVRSERDFQPHVGICPRRHTSAKVRRPTIQ